MRMTIHIWNLPDDLKHSFLHYFTDLNDIREFSTFESYYNSVLKSHDIHTLNFAQKQFIKTFAKKTYNFAKHNRLIVLINDEDKVLELFENGLIQNYSYWTKSFIIIEFYNEEFYEVCP